MEKLKDIREALAFLNDGDIITSDGKDQFLLREKKVYRYADGSRYVLSIGDFKELYEKTVFYLYEDSVTVDETKDEAYYRYYRK